MSSSEPPDQATVQAFGFHQLRQACEISTLRQDITRILANAADLQILIENEVEQVRQHLGSLSSAELQDAATLSPLLSEALTALIEIRDASRRLESSLGDRDQPPPQSRRSPPLKPQPEPRPPVADHPPVAPPPATPPPPRHATSTPTPTPSPPPAVALRGPNGRAKETNWLMPVHQR